MSTHKPESSPKPARTQPAAPPRATTAGSTSEREPEGDVEDIDLEHIDDEGGEDEPETRSERATLNEQR